jgi:hypothetical protein
MRHELNSLWIGTHLTWLEKLCLTSWLGHDHRVVLWTYGAVEQIPNGVDLRDAREILPHDAIIRHRESGSVALFANRFRYHLLRQFPVTWLDTDVLLLRPLMDDSHYFFGWEGLVEGRDSICNAVLRLPSDSAVLRDLLRLTDARVPVPQWWPLKDRLRQRTRGLLGQHQLAENMKWGTFGPRALTETLRRHALLDLAYSRDVFYPILWDEVALFWGSPEIVEARLSARTLAVHLWSTSSLMATPELVEKRRALPPNESWIGKKCAAHQINCAPV